VATHAITRPPEPYNEPIKSYAPGSPEREELRARLDELAGQEIELPLVIGGKDVKLAETFDQVMPHDKDHVLAKVSKGDASHVQKSIDAAAAAWNDWSRTPWEERAAVLLRAAELLTGPWRATLNAATMLGQSKTAHQAEIDAACELADFWRFNVSYMTRIYEEQPISSPGVWNRMEYRPLEGFVFAVTPFNFTAIGGNLPTSPALMGNTVVWKPASTAAYSAHFLMRLLQEAGLPDGVINLVYGSGAEIGDAAFASEHLAIAFVALVQGIWGPDVHAYTVPAWMHETTTVLGAHIPNDRWVEIAAAAAVLVALQLFLRRTRYGLIIRAGVENRAMVTALGIDVRKAFTLVFAIGGIAAALAGVLSGVYYTTIDPNQGTNLLIFAFIVVVIGGLGSIVGSAIAAVVVGLVQQYANYYATNWIGDWGLGDLAVLLLLAVVLLARPRGLAGAVAA
jgi:branched-subunit amino acid ABC-type transport system permease component